MTMSLSTDFREACSDCFINRDFLRRNIKDIDYDLANSHEDVTTKDLFLGDRGKQCVLQLLQLLKLQIEVYGEIRSRLVDSELQQMLSDCGIPGSYIEILDNCDDQQKPRIEDQEETTCVYFGDGQIQGIKYDSLVHFTDTFLMFIKQKLENHKEQCSLRSDCMYCITFEETFREITPLLKDFGSYTTEWEDDCDSGVEDDEDEDFRDDTSSTSSDDGFIDDEDEGPRDDLSTSSELGYEFDDTVEEAALQVDYTWEHFSEIVLRKYKDLAEKCQEKRRIYGGGPHPVLLLYCDKNNDIKAVRCVSVIEARQKAYQIKDKSQHPLPVVLIDDNQTLGKASHLPKASSLKRMVRKLDAKDEVRVGVEDSPSVGGKLKTPEGGEPFEVELEFYIDTGADCGSVGYDISLIKHFVLTVENINNQLTPAIICKVAIGNEEEIEVYDIDENQHWNAIGLSVLKKYHGMYISFNNDKVELGKQDDVTETEKPDGSFQVTFRKDSKAASFVNIDPTDSNDC